MAQIVSDAPEAYDTLKEISDWISSHASDAAEMNSSIQQNASDIGTLETTVANKVDKVEGKQLSTEDYTTAEKSKLAGIAEGAQVNAIDAVSSEFVINPDGKTLSLAAVAMDKVTGLSAALAGKVDAEAGKGLSSNDYTTTEKQKLAGIAPLAEVNVIEEIQVNGSPVSPSDKTVNITVPTGALASKDEVAESDLASALASKINGKADDSALAAIAKTGNVSDLILSPGDVIILNGGTATTVI